MKKLKLFFALFAMLALGVTNAWGAEQTVKWTATSGALGNGIGSGTIKTGTYAWNYTRTLISGASYTGWSSSCIQLGKNGGVENITFTTSAIPGTIKSVAVECSSYNNAHKVSIAVGGTTYLAATATAKWTTVGTKTGTGSSTGTINISFTGGTRALYIKSITVVYEETSSGGTEPVLSSIEISGDLTKKTYEEGDELDLAGLTVNATYDDASTKVVTNDVEWSYTPNPLTEGTTSVDITASYEEKTVTKTITGLTVNEHIITPSEYCIVPNNAFWGTSYNGSDANAATTLSGTQNDISILHTKSGSNLYVNNTQTRVYTNHAMQISVPSGYVITSIAFTADGNNWAGTHTANVGKMTDSKNWAGFANEVTITFGGTCRITKICVNYIKDVKYALTITKPAAGTGTLVVKDGENALTSGAEIYEGTKLTVISTPENGYEEGVVVVKNASDEDVTATIYADGVLTMPAYAVTISATFEKKPCELLAKPTVSAETTYSSAKLTWEAVANAEKYSVKVGTADAVETTETSYDITGLTAETTYTYQVQAIAEAGQDTYCDSEVAEGTFTTATAPIATLTLSDIDGTTTQTGVLNGTITLPTTAAECSKTFVGWSAVEILEPGEKPATNFYARGAEYTLAAETQTLYAVYADGESGEPTWNRVTNLAALTSGGTFILGYEATAKSGKIIPMRTSGTATTSAAGYMYSGNAGGTTSNNATLDMASISESSKFEIVLEASSIVDGAVNIKLGDNYLGNTNTKNNCKLFTSASKNTAFTPTIGTNDVVKLTIKANEDYTTLQFNNNSGSYRYAVYGGAQKDVVFYKKEITSSYSNYSTTCAAAPIATIDPTSVTATAAGAEGKVTVTYENVNTANVSVALYNDEACAEAFTDGWLTASLDGDKNITYTVAENTTYAERKAYIKLTAPETTGATEPAVVVIPVTQAGKDKVFASLEALLAAITPTTEGVEITVTLTNEVIQDFYKSSSYTNGIALNVPYEGGVKVIEIYCKDVPAEWVKGGKVSGTITCPWKLYNSTWELCPTAWTELTYTAPATVKSIAVSGTPTKTTYVDGEAFDPTGLVVTATLTDDSTEPIDVALVDWTFDPETLSKGETSVSVVATYNTMASAAYEVTGLTVNDIPTKTVAEFIAAGGTRCYLEGIVSGLTEGNSMKYGNFDLTDASGTIYVYGCLNAAGESQKFADLGVKNGDKIKVIADEYELYGGTKQEAKNVQYVSHVSAASITIADITMEVGETKTIAATITPDAAQSTVQYAITSGNEYITLDGTTITANAVGTATITATVAEGADYLANSVDFTVKVTPKSEKTNVVILAQYEGDWYAMTNACTDNKQMGALKVTYVNGVILDFVGDKASITWERAVVGNKATFKNNGKYLVGGASTTLNYTSSTFEWDVVDGKYLSDANTRTFLYYKGGYFKNYATSNAEPSKTEYSAMPVVTAVEFMNSVATPSVEKGIFSVADGKFVQFSTGNLQYDVEKNKWSFASEQYEVIGGEAYDPANPTNTNYGMNEPGYIGKLDLFGWSSDGKFGVNPSNTDANYEDAFADWGNLVNEEGWYTLTKDEMNYILNRKKDGKKLWALATVCGMNGLILLPDNWNTSTTLEYGYVPAEFNYTKNQLDAAAWADLEAAGAVFLPEGGTRVGGHGNKDQGGGPAEFDAHGDYFHVDNVGEMGYYWLNTQDTRTGFENCASYLILPGWSEGATDANEDDICLQPQVWSREKRRGNSVRLVKEITPNYTRTVTSGRYGTICLENGGQMIGASLFGLSYYNEAQGLLYMDEVGTTTMTAGNPYIFLPNERATKDSFYVFYDETTAADALTVNGLVGYLGDENKQLEGDGTNYILQDNKIKKVVGGNNSNVFVTKNRAYIQLGAVNPTEQAPVPGRRRVAIGQAPQVATGMESVDASAQPVKMIIDGQLYILRGEKMYDAQGKLVK